MTEDEKAKRRRKWSIENPPHPIKGSGDEVMKYIGSEKVNVDKNKKRGK